MKTEKTTAETIAELQAQLEAHRATLIAEIVETVQQNGIDPRAVCEALIPRRRRAAVPQSPDTANPPAPEAVHAA